MCKRKYVHTVKKIKESQNKKKKQKAAFKTISFYTNMVDPLKKMAYLCLACCGTTKRNRSTV